MLRNLRFCWTKMLVLPALLWTKNPARVSLLMASMMRACRQHNGVRGIARLWQIYTMCFLAVAQILLLRFNCWLSGLRLDLSWGLRWGKCGGTLLVLSFWKHNKWWLVILGLPLPSLIFKQGFPALVDGLVVPPLMPPRSMYLSKHVIRNVRRFRLRAHSLTVESFICHICQWCSGNGHCDKCSCAAVQAMHLKWGALFSSVKTCLCALSGKFMFLFLPFCLSFLWRPLTLSNFLCFLFSTARQTLPLYLRRNGTWRVAFVAARHGRQPIREQW